MIRELRTAAILTSACAAGFAGVEYGLPMLEAPYIAGASPEHPTDVSEQAIAAPLPEAVKQAEASAVSFSFPLPGNIAVRGSGTAIEVGGKPALLGAAHITAFGSASKFCMSREVYLPGKDGVVSRPNRISPSTPYPENADYDADYNHGVDSSVSILKPTSFKGVQLMQPQVSSSVYRGERIYSINYQSTGNKTTRVAGKDKPSVTLGVVVDVHGKTFDMVTNVRAYDESGDKSSHDGASGGTEVDEQGNLVGNLVAASSGETPYSNDDIHHMYNVQLPKSADGYQVATVQIVTKAVARKLYQQAANANPCIS